MNRFDALIDSFVAGRISRRGLVRGAAALGLSGAALATLERAHVLAAQPADNSIRWVSPRGTIDVLDDYPYHVAMKFGYFGDIQTTLEPGPIEATAGTKAVDTGQADVAYPSPGVFSLMIEQGSPLVSAFQMGAYDVFDFAFPKGKAPASVKDLEGMTVVLGSAGWQGITNPEIAQAGGDPSKVNYVDAGQTWAQALAQGQADAALSWEGLRAQWAATGLDFDYILGKDWSKFPANSFVIRRSDLEEGSLADIYTRYFRAWAMGLEFGYHNPVATTQITMEALPTLKEVFEDKQIAVQSMWELAQVFRGDWATRQGWGWHDEASWDTFLSTAHGIGQLSKELKAADIVSNQYIAGANDFDHAKVVADADGFALSADFASLTQPEGAGAE
ncbi:MAG: ABC transporter substrate-binding protein [Thermomicrobiales bacterium]|nr:ABC transporter substrate-binding protein [Thermomicrobiales bacterium]